MCATLVGVVDSSGDVELTFLGYPFESLGRIFNSILTVITVGRKQPDHLISAAGGRTGDIAGSKIDGFSNGIFVLQRPLHHAKTSAMPTVPLQRPTENPGGSLYHRADHVGQLHPDMASTRILQVFQYDKRSSGGRGGNLPRRWRKPSARALGRVRELAIRAGVIHRRRKLLRQDF